MKTLAFIQLELENDTWFSLISIRNNNTPDNKLSEYAVLVHKNPGRRATSKRVRAGHDSPAEEEDSMRAEDITLILLKHAQKRARSWPMLSRTALHCSYPTFF